MFASAIAFALALNGWALAAGNADQPFQREAAVKLLGYDPEAPTDLCRTNTHRAKGFLFSDGEQQSKVIFFLKESGELAAERVACPKLAPEQEVTPFVAKELPPPVCVNVAEIVGGPVTQHVSEMMSTDHPDVVAGYADGVAQALGTVRDACTSNKEAWAKVATQALLFENRAATIRATRSCALWRLALDKELKAATVAGESNGRAAGLTYFQTRAAAAFDGARHLCDADSTASLIDANVGLTKMLIDSMPEK